MTIPSDDKGMVHPSVYSHAAALMLRVAPAPRSHDGLRYRCPESDSLVCITDDATLDALERPRARLRCPACRKVHLVTQDGNGR